MRLFSLIFTFCLLTSMISAQSFQRTYKLQNDEQSFNIAGTQLVDESYISMEGILIDSTFRNMLITHYDAKGTIVWGRQLFFDAGEDVELNIADGSIFQGENDSLYFSLTVFRDDEPNKFIGAMSKDGEAGWGKLINPNAGSDHSDLGSNIITPYFSKTLLNSTQVESADAPRNLISRIDLDGTIRSSHEVTAEFDSESTNIITFDIKAKKDSTYMTTGVLENSLTYFLNVVDSNSVPKISKTFGDNVNFFSIYAGTSVNETPDTGYVVGGQFININIADPANSYIGSFVSKHDSLGDIVWSKRVNFGNEEINFLTGIVVNEDGSIVVGGNVVNDTTLDNYMAKLDRNGRTLWTRLYNKVNVQITNLGDVLKTADMGYAYFNTAIVNDVLPATNFIKTDPDGLTTCEDTISREIFEDIPLLSVDYRVTLTSLEDVSLDSFDYRADGFNSHAVPDLTLETEMFCPNEPINWLFDASIPGATSYMWNTGETTDTLRVFDDETYSVTVTVGEEVCYMLCDTAAVSRFTLPQAIGNYGCGSGVYQLGVGVTAQAGIDSLVWSTGDKNVNQITVAEQGIYTVTVTDRCGETAVATIDVDPPLPLISPVLESCSPDGFVLNANFDSTQILSIEWSTGAQDSGKTRIMVTESGQYTVTITDICNETSTGTVTAPALPDQVTITADFSGICNNGPAALAANANGPVVSYAWSNGSDADVSLITQPGVYSVTVTDQCGNQLTQSINIDIDDFPILVTDVQIVRIEDDFCLDNKVKLVANVVGPTHGLEWSTGETGGEIRVPVEDQTIILTALDDCGNKTDELLINNTPEPCIKYPKVFFGSGVSLSEQTNEINDRFGGFSAGCTEEFTNYEFHIYNRFGQEVFSSNDVDEHWDGTLGNGDVNAPPGVYVWWARWQTTQCTIETKGDVTLLK